MTTTIYTDFDDNTVLPDKCPNLWSI